MDRRHLVVTSCGLNLQNSNGVRTRKTSFRIPTAMKTSDLIRVQIVLLFISVSLHLMQSKVYEILCIRNN
jgi:hypothetical protein